MHHHHINLNPNVQGEIKSYRAFAFKQNMLELAIAMILANCFNRVVTSMTESILMPLVNYLTNNPIENNWRKLEFKACDGLVFEVGNFIGSFIDFIIISTLFYVIYVKFVSPIFNKISPKEEKTCQFCQMTISDKAIKCPYCTTNLQ